MDLRLQSAEGLEALSTPLLAVPVLKGDDDLAITPGEADGLVVRSPGWEGDLSWRAGRRVSVYRSGDGPARVVYIGVGKGLDELDAEAVRRYAGSVIRAAEEMRVGTVALLVPESAALHGTAAHRAAAEGIVLASWRFRELKTGVGEEEAPSAVTAATLIALSGDPSALASSVEEGRIVAEAENLARTLQSRPGNVATPTALGMVALQLAEEHGLRADVLGPDRLAEERMNAILAVSQGSAQEPRLIVLSHDGGGPQDPPLILVGKGLTFDAGGISLKPASGMEDMKFDMSGGAAVLAAMTAVARLGVPRNVVGIVPSSENLLGASAIKPGDVIRTRAGITVEVVNTDAEGRLILCDALDYAVEQKPEAIVDCATLTGAVVIGLGHQAIGLLGTNPALVDEVREAGAAAGERCWELPLWPEYRKQLESETADVKNVGGRPAGTITAATFLREFVKEVPWAHLDIAGTAYGDGNDVPYRRKGGYGVPTRLLVEWVRRRGE
ncbi:MAG: leucyl aminopeptidase [Gemmatimonadales bacterium]|jgi:leucyl aminopeptidase|nr:MAG: leucyl aminopeptidase [Gemmatimonadales bacterium]